MRPIAYFGIDPGKTGAISLLYRRNVAVWDMPMDGGDYDPWRIRQILTMDIKCPKVIGLELSWRFPKLTRGIGILWAIAKMTADAEVVNVRPQQWLKYHNIKKADKAISLAKARELFPGMVPNLERKMDHDRAEALLIAEYVRNTQ